MLDKQGTQAFPLAILSLTWTETRILAHPHPDSAPHCALAVVKASASKVFCWTSCPLPEPVAGLGLAESFTERTARGFANRRRRGMRKDSAPMLAGSSCTHTTSRPRGVG